MLYVSTGTQFTCFTGKKVQILTQKALLQYALRLDASVRSCILSLLALLLQKYKYLRTYICISVLYVSTLQCAAALVREMATLESVMARAANSPHKAPE